MEKSNPEIELYNELDKIYYTPDQEGSYGGVEKLLKAAKIKGLKVSRKIIEKYLVNQASYSLHKQARKNFERNPTVVRGIDQQWQADLADMQSISKENDGVKYLLTVIDVFSKYAWAIPIKNKGSNEMLKAFQLLFKIAAPRKPEKIQTDEGKEFLNKELQAFFKSEGVHHFCSHSDKKAAVVERFNRTLKTKIWKYFTARQTYTYITKLFDFVKAYNNSVHRRSLHSRG
jgi:transposase InsO family protein